MTFDLIEVMEAVKIGIEKGTNNVSGCAKETQNNRVRVAIYDELIRIAKEKEND